MSYRVDEFSCSEILENQLSKIKITDLNSIQNN